MAQMWEMGGVDSSHCCKLHLLAGKHLQQVFKNHKESGIKNTTNKHITQVLT